MPTTKSSARRVEQIGPSGDTSSGCEKPVLRTSACATEGEGVTTTATKINFKPEDDAKCTGGFATKSQYAFPALEGGWAWIVVFVGFIVHILTRGILFSTGVLFSEWISFFGKSKADTAWIGSIATGSALLLGPVASRFIEVWGYRVVGIAGGCICTLGFFASYWASGIYFLYLSYGVVAGSGLGTCYICSVVAVGEYFDERRSLAFGIAASGAGCGAAAMAMLQRYLLSEYGWRGTMIILAGVSGLNQIACGALLRPLSSSLNWKSANGKRRLKELHRMTKSQMPDKKNLPDKTEFMPAEQAECINNSKNSLYSEESLDVQFKHATNSSNDSGFTGSDSHEGLTSSTKNSRLNMVVDDVPCESNTEKQCLELPLLPIERSFSGSNIPTALAMSPSLMLRRKLFKTPTRAVQFQGLTSATRESFSMNNLTNSQNSLGPSELYTPCISMEKSTRKLHNKFSRSTQIRTGDALYLSSLSIASSKSVAQALVRDNDKRIDWLEKTDSGDITSCFEKAELGLRRDVNEAECGGVESGNSDPHISQEHEVKFPRPLRNPLFVIIALNQFFTGLGVMVPFVHLAEKAILMGVSETRAALLISFIGIGNVIGKIVLGVLCDMKSTDIFIVFLTSQLGIALGVLLIPSCSSYTFLALFSFMFGFFYGNYAAIPSLVAEYVGLCNLAEAIGYINFLEGAAGILGPPMAGRIYDATLNYNVAFVIAGCFLLVSWLLLFMQPLFYTKITGRKSKTSKWLEAINLNRYRRWKVPTTGPRKRPWPDATINGTDIEQSESLMSDINANFMPNCVAPKESDTARSKKC